PLVPIAFDCKASGQNGFGIGEVSPTLRSMGHKDSHQNAGGQVAICFDTTQITSPENRCNPQPGDPSHPLSAGAHPPAIAFNLRGREEGAVPEVDPDGLACQRAASGGSSRSYVAGPSWGVRRLTPTECERLQGFPDWNGWRDLDEDEDAEQLRALNLTVKQTKRGKWRVNDPDGPRYKALGNSMAVPCMFFIGSRLDIEVRRLSLNLPSAAAA
ncbi:MAG: cytosine methyltransferase, partial [Akkermansiaceae bacterium]|nr:cytosine methyltransferase [Akkermansiaceae bacterium]